MIDRLSESDIIWDKVNNLFLYNLIIQIATVDVMQIETNNNNINTTPNINSSNTAKKK